MAQNLDFQFNYAEATDVGCVRKLNEDSTFSQACLWIVADGMGGHACGEVASAMAVELVSESINLYDEELSEAIQEAHERISEAGRSDAGKLGMGTTIVAMVSDLKQYKISWVGDSRGYLWDGAKLSQITEDHSLIVRLIKAGLITPEDAATHPQRHMITQCLGSSEIQEVVVDSICNEWEAGQQVMMCSDGLTDELSDALIAEIMSSDDDVDGKAKALVDMAKQLGGRDNVSVVIVDSPVNPANRFLQALLDWKERFSHFVSSMSKR